MTRISFVGLWRLCQRRLLVRMRYNALVAAVGIQCYSTFKTSALGYGSYEDTMNALEKAIQPGPFILGDRFSAGCAS